MINGAANCVSSGSKVNKRLLSRQYDKVAIEKIIIFLCFPLVFEFSVGIGVFVIGLSQISLFFSLQSFSEALHSDARGVCKEKKRVI